MTRGWAVLAIAVVATAARAPASGHATFDLVVKRDAHDRGTPATCRCERALSPRAMAPALQPCELKSVEVTGGSDDQQALVPVITAHIGAVEDLRAAATADLPLSCGEHGTTNEVVGSYGGDPVEMLLTAVVAEKARGKPLTKAELTMLLRTYVAKTRAPSIFYHTDVGAVTFLQRAVGVSNLDITRPPTALRPALVKAMAHPEAHGCAFLRDIVRDPVKYGARPALVHDFFGALHGILWSTRDPLRARFRYYVHMGGKATGATMPSASASPGHSASAHASMPAAAATAAVTAGGAAGYHLKVTPLAPSPSPSQLGFVRRQPTRTATPSVGAPPSLPPFVAAKPSSEVSPTLQARTAGGAARFTNASAAGALHYSVLEPLPRGRFFGVLRPMTNALTSLTGAQAGDLQLQITRSGVLPPLPSPVAVAAAAAAAPDASVSPAATGTGAGGIFGSDSTLRAVLDVRLSPDCSGKGRVVPLQPALTLAMDGKAGAGGAGGGTAAPQRPSFLMFHGDALVQKRRATAALLMKAFGLELDLVMEDLLATGDKWQDKAEELAGVGGPSLPKFKVTIS